MSELHKHHIIPKHANGTDDPSNLIELTIIDHAIAHKVLYHFYGRIQDKIAWLTLSGQIGGQEARLMALRAITVGKKLTREHKLKLSSSHKGLPSGNKGHSQIAWNKGKPFSKESRKKMSLSHFDMVNNPKGGIPPSQRNTIWINNGIINKKISNQTSIPHGWMKGMK